MEDMTAPPMPMPEDTAFTSVMSGKATLMPARPASPTACPTNTPSRMTNTLESMSASMEGMTYERYVRRSETWMKGRRMVCPG